MASLRIEKILYSGRNYTFESELLNKDIILVEGDNGTGKSTFCDLIYFGLGGRVKQFLKNEDKPHAEITSDVDNYVELFITIDGSGFNLRRYISENDITVTPYSHKKVELSTSEAGDDKDAAIPDLIFSPILQPKETQILGLHRSGNVKTTFSDWILGKLSISVVELYQGYKSFKVNFTDLLRLIYHDQQPDPEGIYKRLDGKENFINDSEVLRKAVFELLVGETYSAYYDAIVAEKHAEKDAGIAKSVLDEYVLLSKQLSNSSEVTNISFLQVELQGKEKQLEKLNASRESFKRNRNSVKNRDTEIEKMKAVLINNEMSIGDFNERRLQLYSERFKIVTLQEESIREVSEIQKVLHTHDELNLFSADTCPYCLSKVERKNGHCVCGASIEEEQYERFFYTSQEYNEILKSKLKSLKTIELAYSSCNKEINSVDISIQKASLEAIKAKREISVRLENSDEMIDFDGINDIDDHILLTREQISDLHRAIETESKLQTFQKRFDVASEKLVAAVILRKQLELDSKKDILQKVKAISSIYNDLMIATLPDCRSAKISHHDYMPSINDGRYREASSMVSVRLMYYLALLKLSLEDDTVSFPKILIVDTPETAGIEPKALENLVSKFAELRSLGEKFQVILTTGIGKYPANLSDNRILFMPDKTEMLLKENV